MKQYLCTVAALVWHLFSLLGLLNSFHDKEGPAAHFEAKFRLEVFSG